MRRTDRTTRPGSAGWRFICCIAIALVVGLPARAADSPPPPNILVIMPDDVGMANVGAYSHGLMVPTPNIDRIAREGVLFTDHYAHPTCTPGRAAFMTGQMPIRTGLTTVGMAGSPIGLSGKDPTLAELLKEHGYRTGQFGKNHLGDRNEHLPTVHGFDEFFGNLYHLNTEEEPELGEWPEDPAFDRRYRPRGVLDAVASAVDDPTTDPRFGRVGRQKIRDTGPLTSQRMETVDREFMDRAFGFMAKSVREEKPFFVWHNPTRMHIYTRQAPALRGAAEPYSSRMDVYGSGLMELDGHVGEFLAKLEELGVADNTIVVFTTDNGPQRDSWPDGGATPFRANKGSTWEGGVRVPLLVRWPGHIAPGSVSNGIQTHEDLFTTLAAAVGIPDVAMRLRKSHKVHIDGVDNLAHWEGKSPSARNVVYYYIERELTAIRIGNWKSHFKTRNGMFDTPQPSTLLFNLRMDPYEQHDGNESEDLAMRLGVAFGGQVQDAVDAHLKTLQEFPPRQKGASMRAGID